MTWLITGAQGMLGQDMVAILTDAGETVRATDVDDLDILDPQAVKAALGNGVRVVVNCAAWTDVDGAEDHEDRAGVLNRRGPEVLAEACAENGAWLVHVSTDYVFAGDADQPYEADTPVSPVSAYGRTKAAGEQAVRCSAPDQHFIVRTAWLYGANGPCFPKTIARLAKARGALSVVDDQVGQPTWTRDVADLVVRLVRANAPAGTYHATSSGATTWFEFAQAIVEATGLDPVMVSPTDSAAFAAKAPRPAYSVLGHQSVRDAGVGPIGEWRSRWAEASTAVLG